MTAQNSKKKPLLIVIIIASVLLLFCCGSVYYISSTTTPQPIAVVPSATGQVEPLSTPEPSQPFVVTQDPATIVDHFTPEPTHTLDTSWYSSSATPATTFSLPTAIIAPISLPGRLIVWLDEQVLEITQNPDTGEAEVATLVNEPSLDFAQVSPDHTYLIYTTEEGSFILDLASGNSRMLFPEKMVCAVWSPDSRLISYAERISVSSAYPEDYSFPYVTDTSGNKRRLYEPENAAYTKTGEKEITFPSNNQTEVVYGRSSCAQWLDSTHVIFQRFRGEMPLYVSYPGLNEVAPNTTTMAAVENGAVRLTDVPDFWSVIDTCPQKGLTLLVGGDTEGYVITTMPVDPNQIVRGQIDPHTMLLNYEFAHFAPDCSLVNFDARGLYQLYDPVSQAVTVDYPFAPGLYTKINSEVSYLITGPADQPILAVLISDPGAVNEETDSHLMLFDPVKNHRAPLYDSESPTHYREILAWLPD